ncbi:MAG: M6 family metalloprotease domain-containing protein [Bacteroidota bacterium]
MKKITFLILTMLLVITTVRAAYFERIPYKITQPNGISYNCYVSGDELFNWIHDEEGYTIIQASDGYFYYGEVNGDTVQPTKFLINSVHPASVGIKKWAKISSAEYQRRHDAMFSYENTINSEPTYAPQSGTLNNIVIYIRFSDDAEFTTTRQSYDDKFNPSTGNSLKSYFKEVSYNILTISSSHYPSCAMTTNLSYQDVHPRSYFQPYNATTNPGGYSGGANGSDRTAREHQLLTDAVNWININSSVSASLNIDGDGDNNIDNVCFIVKGSNDAWAELLWAHRWSLYTQNVYINGKRVYDYTFQPESQVAVTTICHEMFHSLGAPDLYHYTNQGVISPVGSWDLMESGGGHMLAYMKWKYSNHTWISSLPEITASGTYTLNPVSSSTNNCYKIASPNSIYEYFVLEYRNKSGTFEINVPGSGLIIYRIDTRVTGNASGPPDEIYIYRPDGTTAVNGNIYNANYSSTVGRTAINNFTNPSSFLQNGSIGGLNISNVTTAGTTISFNVSLPIICTPPSTPSTAFISSLITNASMTVGFTRGNGNAVLVIAKQGSAVNDFPMNGTAYTANASFGSGTQIGVGNYVVYNGTGTSVNITNLTSGTNYYYAIYEYSNTLNCYINTGLTGNTTTSGTPPYCAAGSTATTDEYISKITIGTINQTSSRGTSGYQNFTSQITDMQVGVSKTVSIQVTNPFPIDQVLIWVDWNRDGDFTDAGENVYTSSGSGFSSPHTSSAFSPPSGTTAGLCRMRIRLHTPGNGPNATSCGNSSYGEVEDYTINVSLYPTLTAVISGGLTPICYNTAAGSLTATGGGGTGSYTYLWYKNAVSTGITTQSYTVGNLTSTSTFYCAISSGAAGTLNTSTKTITVYPILTAAISGGTSPICYNASAGTFTATASGGNGSYTYLWYKNGLSTGITTNTYTPPNLTSTSTIYCAITSTTCAILNTATTTITVTTVPTATISYSDTSYCISLNTSQSLVLNGSGNYTGGIYSSTPGLSIASGNGSITPNTSIAAPYIVTYTIPASGGCAAVPVTTSVTITQSPTTALVGTTQNICGTLQSAALGGNTPSIGNGIWTKISGPGTVNFSTVTSGSSTATPNTYGTYVYQWTISNGNCAANSAQLSVTHYPPSIAGCITATANPILGGQNAELTLTGNTGNITKWQKSNNGGNSWTDIASSANPYTETPDTLGTIDYIAVVKSGVCAAVNSAQAAIVVNVNATTFNGSIDNNWDTEGNWNNGIPTNTDNVTIAANKIIEVRTHAVCNNLTIAPLGQLTINAAKDLMVNGTLTLQSDSTGTASLIDYGSLASFSTIVERYIPHTNTDEFHSISSPVLAQAISPIFNQQSGVYLWNEIGSNWLEYSDTISFISANSGSNFIPGKGYVVSYPDVVTKSFTGTLNQGIINIPLTVTPGMYSGWNFIANPYPSAVNWNTSIGWSRNNLANANIGGEKAIWVWNTVAGNYGVYISNASMGTNSVNQHIAFSQGFWVKALSPGILSLNNNVREHSSQLSLKSSTTASKMIRLKVTALDKLFSDEIIISFGNSNNQDGAEKMFSMCENAPSLFSVKSNKDWSINNLTSISQNPVVEIGFKAGIDGNFTLKAFDLNSFDTTTYVYLKDLLSNTITELNQNAIYSFSATKNDNSNRFQLLFASTPLNILSEPHQNSKIYAYNNIIYVNTMENIRKISIFNTLGQFIKTAENMNGKFEINLNGNANGYYIVKVVTEKNIYAEKVFIK